MVLLIPFSLASCQRNNTEKPIPLESVVWYAYKCTNAQNEEILCPYSFIRLHKNGVFLAGALRGYASGMWQKDTARQQIILIPDATSANDELTPTLLGITYQSGHYLNLLMARSDEDIKSGNMQLLRMRPGIVQEKTDPFSPAMQQWRLKPLQPETPDEIRTRTLLYLQFLLKFYSFVAENNLEQPDTDWFPNVINMESPGSIRLAYTTELKDWYSCFFNEEQAIEGYKIISGPFLNIKLKENADLNKRNVSVSEELINEIEKVN